MRQWPRSFSATTVVFFAALNAAKWLLYGRLGRLGRLELRNLATAYAGMLLAA